MIAKVAKWGNSLALRIPQSLAQTLTVQEGRSVRLTIENGNLIVSPIETDTGYDLDHLLDAITPDNLHAEVEYGTPRGHEAF